MTYGTGSNLETMKLCPLGFFCGADGIELVGSCKALEDHGLPACLRGWLKLEGKVVWCNDNRPRHDGESEESVLNFVR
jgi:hypothetical protein